ncbi:hypothetical protein [Pseudosulfitobacter pseudonitzschiae]|uniref:hypothetical protein n=1 Tax=Pseudosulfitobacter pseudonitzschiae TaxID=1402135 RepID=UPI001AF20E83|nr:hypothetical protein [Pseudosulfitobacter pseudonitzschiae]MBM1817163.1 hypothetical protein [Pseudosulfitobacter pseudonitzschiae]MBM1834166.1 hypothetical protein [Pseudosulfitobacter pseudonitzschiae]MBM1839031.1 hypothetical protein [Pseudosulfitobacter pseudonitzschiae]MBM1843881.1 hypothetical protein [Pseudosulfitobacter pseudonitzschiae]MBM1848726.1 hypothetical protein [Pseudosulfitobacter pseudonitzschiae]
MNIATETTKIKRRALFGMTAAAAAMTAAPALAFKMPDAPVQDSPQLPAWWEKLTGASAETDPEVFHPWQDTELSRELGRKLDELHELLLRMGAPSDVNTISGFQMYWDSHGVPQNLTVMGRSGTYGGGLHQFRPEFGWIDRTPKIAGGLV